jgi:hypothetical protein
MRMPYLKNILGSITNRVSSKQTNFFSVRTETNRNSICFGSFSVCFAKLITNFFGLFRFVSVFRTRFETTETNRSVSKQTEKNEKTYKLINCTDKKLPGEKKRSQYSTKRILNCRLPVPDPDPPIRIRQSGSSDPEVLGPPPDPDPPIRRFLALCVCVHMCMCMCM